MTTKTQLWQFDFREWVGLLAYRWRGMPLLVNHLEPVFVYLCTRGRIWEA